MFKKKPDKFLLYLVDFAKHLDKTSDYFIHFKVKDPETLHEFAGTIKRYESEADDKVHTIIKELNDAFITPIEREDILQLTMNLDDVIDGMEELTGWMDIYEIMSSDRYIDEFTFHISKCAKEILTAIELIANGRLADVEPHAIKIKDHESKCDDLYRESLKNLFQKEKDPIKVIQYKEIYETLEDIADYCQNVASTLQSIIMKNA
jgi:predicted phosphate transport protein (TIGR00153 family)